MMENLSELKYIKREPSDLISSDEQKNLTGMLTDIVKEESDSVVQSKYFIKTESHEFESEFEVIAGSSYETGPICDVKIETDEPMVEIEFHDFCNSLQDPLDVSTEINVGEHDKHFLSALEDSMTFKKEVTGEEHHLINIVEPEATEKGETKNKKRYHRNKNYICDVCQKKFICRGHLEDHFRIHTGEKPFSCNICEKSFNRKHTLVNHLHIHKGEKRYTCDICKNHFQLKSQLKSHMLIHSIFRCNECDESFKHISDLNEHKLTHTNRPYACDLCNKRFKRRNHVTEHQRTHTGKKSYPCKVCKIPFGQKAKLAAHIHTHSDVEIYSDF